MKLPFKLWDDEEDKVESKPTNDCKEDDKSTNTPTSNTKEDTPIFQKVEPIIKVKEFTYQDDDLDLEQMESTLPTDISENYNPLDSSHDPIDEEYNKDYKGPVNPSFSKIIHPSKDMYAIINNYIATTSIPYYEVDSDYKGQAYNYNGTFVTSDDPKFWDDLYKLIADLKNTSCINKLANLNKDIISNTTFASKVKALIDDSTFTSKDYVFADKLDNKPKITKIITQTFNHVVKEILYPKIKTEEENILHMEKSYDKEEQPQAILDLPVKRIAFTIGKSLAYSYVNKYILFNVKQEVKEKDDNNEFYHSKLKDSLEKLYKRIKDNTFKLAELDTIILPYTFLDDKERTRCYTLLHLSLYDSDIAGDRWNKDNFADYNALDLTLQQIAINEGMKILDLLQEHKIITMQHKSQRNIPSIQITEDMQVEMLASSTYFKPYLELSNRNVLPKLELKVVKDLSFTTYQEDKKHKSNVDNHITPKDTFNEYINYADTIQYCIDRQQVTTIYNFFTNAIEKPFDKDDQELLQFCRMIYDIDFAQAFLNTSNPELLEQVMQFALDYETLHHRKLKKECSIDGACKMFYNTISSYKYYIIGILNDVNVYQGFNYFYIPKFGANTGRTFSYPGFLQLQAHKFAKAFILLYSTGSLNEEAYVKLNAYITTLLNTQVNSSDEPIPIKDISFKQYKQEMITNLNKYLKSFFEEDLDITKYPKEASDKEQITWIFDNIKNKKETLLVKGLFTAKYNRSYGNILYTKDATTSGPQFISLLERDPHLANLSNMISTKPQDIYTTVLHAITRMLGKNYEHFLIPSFRILFNLTLEQIQCIPISTIKPSDDILQQIRDYILTDCNIDTTDALKRLVTRMSKAMVKPSTVFKETLIELQKIKVINFEPNMKSPTKEIFLQLNLCK